MLGRAQRACVFDATAVLCTERAAPGTCVPIEGCGAVTDSEPRANLQKAHLMPNRANRRAFTVAVAFGLALGSSVIALALPATPELPDEASDQATEAVTSAPARTQDAETPEVEENGAGDNAEAFSQWVQSIPEDWGCVRGQLVSSVARGDHRGDDFEGPTYASLEEAAADLGMEERRCVEAALNGDDEGDESGEAELEDEDAGRPDGVGNGRPDGVPPGPPDHAAQGGAASDGE